MKKQFKSKNNSGRVFFKSMILTISALLLILVGYFTAGYFTGGI